MLPNETRINHITEVIRNIKRLMFYKKIVDNLDDVHAGYYVENIRLLHSFMSDPKLIFEI